MGKDQTGAAQLRLAGSAIAQNVALHLMNCIMDCRVKPGNDER
jgi:hypothetical protein